MVPCLPYLSFGGHFNWMVLDAISLLSWLASVVSLTQLGRGNRSQGIASRWLVCGHGHGAFYITIIINLYRRVSAYCGSAIHEQVDLGCIWKEVEQVRGKKLVRSISLWFPSASASSFFLEFLPFSLMIDYIHLSQINTSLFLYLVILDGRLVIVNVIFMWVVDFLYL